MQQIQSRESFNIKTPDGTEIKATKYIPKTDSIGSVIIVHGMAEHQKRYSEFAEILNDNHFTVYTYDQRGHGETAGSIEKIGFFAPKNGWDKVVSDLHLLVEIVKEENSELPLFILGHSMGSFVTRSYIISGSPHINGVIFSGTAGSAGLLGKAGIFISAMVALFRGKEFPSKIMDSLSFGDFNKAFKPNRTKFDWLSKDESAVDKYINDTYCGTVFSAQFFNDMLKGIEKANNPKFAKLISNDLPMFLFSGKDDPVGDFGKGVVKVEAMYKECGIKNIKTILYEKGRHEMLNETNKKDVYSDIVNWLNAQIK